MPCDAAHHDSQPLDEKQPNKKISQAASTEQTAEEKKKEKKQGALTVSSP
jgi:hypothetical protein